MSLLSFNDMHKSYGDKVALRGVSLEVNEGEVFGLLGPNGAGKTSLIRILMDIIRADSGTITLFGEPHNREHLNRVGYLPEERGLYTKHKVLQVMTYFGMLKGLSRQDARERSREWLARVDLAETESWKIERLSKGMGQKVQIASTLLPEPELCVLDEPFSGLDPINTRLVQELIHERRKSGKTTILSTHQMNQVEALCDRVGLINRGRLVAYGAVDEVREQHSSPEVQVTASGSLPPIPGVEGVRQDGDDSWHLTLADGVAPRDVLAELVRAGVAVDRFEKTLAPMEDVFVQVVEGDRP